MTVSIVRNALARSRGKYGFQQLISRVDTHSARAEISKWPAFAETPLRQLVPLAERSRVAAIHYKDEASRLGLGSFKALGGAYAVARLLQRLVARRTGEIVEISDLITGRFRSITGEITVVSATDGNHGRSVAWGARLFGCRCCILIHAGVSDGRRDAIASYGAEVIRIKGDYDDSVHDALELANQSGWELVADTSSPGHEQTCVDVLRGYTVMAAETLDQILAGGGQLPTHVFIQGGVGGLAAAVCAHFWDALDAATPIFILVEPDRADCLYQSARLGRPARASSDLDTVMAGLACGEVSLLAWRILREAAEFFMTLSDAEAISMMRLLADPRQAGANIIAGESAGVGLAGFVKAASDPAARELLRLDAGSRILAFGTEGATDPKHYAELISPARP